MNSNTGGVAKPSFAIRLFALILLTTLAACGGSGGETSTGSLSAPLGAGIDENVQRNPENTINASTVNAVEIEVVLGADVQVGQKVTVVLTDGVNEVTATVDAVPNSTMLIGPIDASALNDGPIELIVTMSSGANSISTSFGTILFKDTTPPAMPTMVEFLAGASNAAGVANLSNEAAASFAVTFDAQGESQDLVSILVDDSQTVVTSPAENVIPSGVVSISGVDISSLLDGNLTITAEIVDPAENKTTFQILGLKDTTTPGVVLARVVSGSSGQPNTVTQNNLNSARVDVAIDSTAVSGDQVALNVIDINGAMVSAPAQAVAPGGATLSFTGLDLSPLADGTLILEAVVSDLNGNSVPDQNFSASKDASTTDLESAYVMAGQNNALHVINGFNAGEVYVEVNATSIFDEGQNEQIRASFDFNGNVITSSYVATTGGVSSMVLGPFDFSLVSDSSYDLLIEMRDAFGNVVRTPGISGILDATAPSGINIAFIPAGSGAPVDTINSTSQSSFSVNASFKPDNGPRTATISLVQGVQRISAAPITVANGGGQVTVSGFDASSLNDGVVEIEVHISDDAGNFFNQPGRSAIKDTVAIRPTSAFVAAGQGNQQGIINVSQVASTTVNVTLPSNSSASESYQVVVSDGSASVQSGTQNGASGATLVFGGLDLSSLADGAISLNVRVFDAAGNTAFGTAGTAQKDATAPVAPSSARVTAGPNNPIDRINADTEANTVVEVRMPGGVNINDQMTVTLSSGTQLVRSEARPCPKSNSSATFNFDTTSLPEGPIGVSVSIFDAAGNTTNFNGTKATKDLSVVQPVAAAINAGASNPSDTINSASTGSVSVSVTMPAATVGGERVSVILSDGANSVTSAEQQAPAGGATLNFSLDASSLADGPISVTSAVNEPSSGNSTVFSGTPAVKDTVAPAMVTAVLVPASGSAPQGYVNGTTVGSVTFRVSHGSQYDGTETLDVTVADGAANTLVQPSRVLGASAAVETYANVNMSALNDGGLGLSVTVTDLAGNSNQQTFALATLDTASPEAITAFSFSDSGTAVINSANETSIELTAPVAVTSEIGDTLRLSFTNGSQKKDSAILTQDGTLTEWHFVGEDLSSLPDGTIVINGRLVDAAGNETLFTANSLTKDSSPPAAPLSAHVNAGGSNPIDFVNGASVTAVSVDVAYAASSTNLDQTRLTISDGVSSMTSALVTAPNGAGTLTFGPFDLSAYNEGAINLSVYIVDTAGNTVVTAGTSAVKDTVNPVAPTSLAVIAGSDNNAGFISAISSTAAVVEGVWPGSADGTETAIIDLGGVMSASTAIPMGGGTVAFPSMDVSAISDGVLSLSVTVSDPAGNVTIFVGTLPTLDTVPPVAPSMAQVAAGASNSADIVNSSNFTSAQVDVTWPGGASAGDTAIVMIDDGATTLSSLMMNANPGAVVSYTMNFSLLSDGAINLNVEVQDPAGNKTTFAGNAALKDTVAPVAPNSASVAVSAGNNTDEINNASQGAVQIDVAWPGTADAADSVTLTLRDGANPDVVSASMNPVVGGTTMFTLDASSLNEGTISLIVDVTDVNGNTTQFNGTPALKDTIAPLDPTSGGVAAGASNAPDIVNENNVAAAQIDVVWPAGSAATDTFEVSVDDGGAPLVSATTAVTPGATASVTMDLSTLGEGSLNINVTTYDTAGNSTTFACTPATKDTVDPVLPTAGSVAVSAGNGVNEINAASEAAVQVDVVWSAGADALDTATVTLSDGVNAPVVSGSMVANPSNTVSYTLDSSSLNEGSIAILVTVTDPAGNVDTFSGTAATKDVTAPVAPTSAAVTMTGSNPVDTINENNVAAVGIDVVWPAGADATATATVTIGDGANPDVVSGSLSVNPGNTVAYSLDASSLNEGAITITVDIIDPFGNTTSSAGTAITKDTVDPVLASAAQVMAGTSNAADIINENNVATVMVEVTWPGGADATDSATITLGDGANPDVVSSALNPNPGGTTTYSIDASSLNEGAITVTLSVTDLAGNNDTFSGTAATKDTVDPVLPTAGSVAVSAGNGVNEINAASEAAVQVDVVWSAGASALDSATVTLDDGVNAPVVSGSMAANPSNTVSYSIDSSSLNEGSIAILVTVTDPNGNVDTFAGTMATKDVTAPIAPTSAAVTMTASNPADTINENNVAAVGIDVAWSAGADSSATAIVTIGDGANPDVVSGVFVVTPGSTLPYSLDASSLNEGAITITVDVTDPFGNATSFAGTAATKDTVDPVLPTGASVAVSAGNNADEINAASEAAVQVDVVWSAGANALDTATVTLDDGVNTPVVSGSMAANPSNTVSYSVDSSTLDEGTISITVTVTDPAGNVDTFAGTMATKDVTAPVAPTSAAVTMTGSNPADTINENNVAAVGIDVVWPAGADATATATVTIGDGANPDVVSGSMAVNPGNTVAYSLDASSLNDDTITITVAIIDPFGNTTNAVGTAATKDTVDPVLASAAQVIAGASNAPDIINENNVSTVMVEVTLPGGADATDSATITLGDGANPDVVSSALNPNPGGTTTYSLDASSLNEGAITVTLSVTDLAGNNDTFAGTAATKDTVDPVLPTSGSVAVSAGNGVNEINAASEAAVQVDVVWSAGANALDTATVTLSDGVNAPVVSGALVANPSNTVSYSIDSSSLNEGSIAILVTVTDPNGNVDTFSGTAATKDVTAPVAPSSAAVTMTGSNPADTINENNVAAVGIDVVWPAGADATATATVTIGDGANPDVVSGSLAVNPGNTVAYSLDASSLNEGAITITVDIIDPFGNTTSSAGTAITKDTVDPVLASAAQVMAGTSNSADIINENNVATVMVEVTWPGGADATDSATITLGDGANPDVVSSVLNPNPGGTTTYSLDASSLNEGAITVTLSVTDLAGNNDTFAGTAATKDTVDPVLPTSGSVAVSAGNGVNEINAASEAAVQVDVVWSAGANALDTATVTLDDGVNAPVVSGSMAANPSNTVSYSIDSSSLNEGSIAILVTVTDPNGNVDTFSGTAATKDVTAPVAPSSAAVTMTGSNPVDTINENNVAAVGIDVVWPAGADATATATVTIGDGANPDVVSGSLSVNPGNTVAYSLDASSLNEGAITITVDITDPFGNTTSSAGTAITKDTVDPVLASAAQVMAGTSNSADIINENNVATVMVEVTWPGGADATDSATITLGDGANPDVVSSALNPNPGGTTTYSIDASSLNEGAITVTLSVTDLAGNNDTFAGTAATKDTVDPVLPTAGSVAVSAGNGVNQINAASEAAVQVDVVWSAGANALDTATVTLDDGVNAPVVSGSMAANPSNTVSYSIDSSSLNEGSIAILVTVTDPNGNVDTFSGTAATKDVTAPIAPTSAAVVMTSANPADTINENNVSSVGVRVLWPLGADASATATVTLGDGANPDVVSGALSVFPGANINYSLDATSLNEGAITITVDITDPHGNTTSAMGTAVTKDTVDPVLPTSGSVAVSAGNGVNEINAASEAAVQVDVVWSAGASALDSATVTLDDGVNAPVVSGSMAANPSNTVSYSIDSSSLNEGSISIVVTVTDPAGNVDTFSGTAATKDVTAPIAPSSAAVTMTGSNPADTINENNVAAVGIDVVWPAGADATATATVTIGDGANPDVVSGSLSVNPGNTVAYSLDASSLNEGAITITVDITDPFGNTTSSAGTAITKDTVDPVLASAAQVMAGTSNSADIINENNVATVMVEVTWPGGADATDSATITLGDGANPDVVSSALNPNPGGTTTYSLDASSLNEGAITVTLSVTDLAGNNDTFSGTAATKDTVDPVLPTSGSVAVSAGNGVNEINAASEAAVQVDVVWSAGANALDSATVTLSDGVNAPVVSGSMAANPSNTVSYTLDSSSLNEGSIAILVTVTDPNGNVDTFSGTVATKDVSAPIAPTSAAVTMTGTNPANTINEINVLAVGIDVVWPAGADATATATVTIGDGANPDVVSGSLAVNPGNTVAYSLDASSLNEGAITITVDITDPFGNTASAMGTAVTKDTVDPVVATAAQVAAGAQNAADSINLANQASVSVEVTWPGGASAADLATVILSDGVNPDVVSSAQAPNPGGMTTYMVDASSLNEGAINVTVSVDDLAGNNDTFAGTPATKDAVAPLAATSAQVAAGGGNAADVINSSNVSGVQVDVVWPAGASALDTAIVTLGDGANTAVSGSLAVNPGNTVSYTIDASGLNDAIISITVDVTDPAMNSTSSAGVSALKDATDPVAPTAAAVQAGSSNPADVINSGSEASVNVQVDWPGGAVAADMATVSLDDGVNPPVVSAAQNVAPGASVIYNLDASSLNEGNINITVDIVDAVGNSNSAAGTAATKDTMAPLDPTAASVTAGASNNADFITAASVSSVSIDVTFDVSADMADTAIVILGDGVTTAQSSSIAVNPGGTVNYTVDASGLADGSITVSVDVTDVNGNVATFAGTAATKDSMAPAAPTLLQIPAGVNNPVDTVNASTASSVNFAVSFPASSLATDMITITVTDSGLAMQSYGPFAAPAGGGIQVYAANDLSALADGSLSIDASIEDLAGNTSNFMGMTATKDTVLANATAAAVAAGAMNSADIINSSSASAVQVDVTMPGSSDGSESIVVSLFDGVSTVNSGSFAVPMGGGLVMATGINAAGLNEGAITVSVAVSDAAGNMQTFVGTAATKDTVAPTLPTAASVVAGGMNSADEINTSSQFAVQVDVVWPAGASASDTAIVTLSDGAASQSSGSLAANPGMTVSYTLDASSLAEGSISISVDVTDPNGNTAAFNGTAATKDTIVVAASSATIPSSANNAADRISSANAGSVQVDVTFPASADGSETATVALSDGVNPDVVSSAMPLSAGGGVLSFSGLDASGLNDGGINVIVTVTDDKQNSTSGTAISAQKDTSAPAQPTAAKVAATMNNADHFINIASESSVSVELTFPAGSNADDVATITLSNGAASVMATINAPAGGGMVTASGISSTALAEGTITLSVDMTDGAGNTAATFAGSSATKDVTAPPTVVVDPVTSPWNQATQDITGVGPLNTDIVVDGGAAQAVAISNSGGAFVVTVSLTASSTNSLTVYSRDLAGNPSTLVTLDYNATALDILQDSTAPSVPYSNVTVAKGLGNAGAADGGAFADFDNDGDLDLFVGQAGAGILYEYDSGTGTFSDITASTGVTFAGDSSAVWGDYDNDGDQDLLTVDSVVGTTLYRNDFIGLGTKTFTDVTVSESAGIASTTLTQAFWLDHDNDGYLDFLVLDASLNNNYLMANQRGAGVPANSFSRDSTTGIDNNIAASAFGAVADFDVDGDVDVIFGDNLPGLFYRNDAMTSFTDIAGATSNVSFDHSAGGRGIVFVDYDNDGDFDLFIARGGASNVNQLWRNDGASSFTEVATLAGIDTDVDADDICFGDVDNDGFLDLFIGSNGSNKLYRGLGDTNMDNVFEFIEIASDLGVSVDDANDADMVQMADIDNDGDLDLFVGNEGAGDVLYQNDLDNFRFVKVKINGKGTGSGFSSKDALGAVVLLKDASGNVLASREISGGRGKGSQDARVIHFGGVTPSVKYRIEVRFTSGVTKTIFVAPKLLPGHTFTINE